MIKPLKAALCFLLLAFCLNCGFPSEAKVKDDFRQANPTFKPISAIVGEGNSDAAYYHVQYKKPNDEKIYEQVWLYLRQDDGNIKLTNKEKETVVE